MEMVVTTGGVRRAMVQSNCLHQQTNTQLFTGRMHFLSSNQQCQSTEGKSITFHWLALPRSLGVFQSCPWPLNAPGYLGEGCHAFHQPSDASTPRIVKNNKWITTTDWYKLMVIGDALCSCLRSRLAVRMNDVKQTDDITSIFHAEHKTQTLSVPDATKQSSSN